MELQLVSFEQAKELNSLGFQYICEDRYIVKDNVWDEYVKYNTGDIVYAGCGLSADECIEAPTLELVAKWLRDEKDILIEITRVFGKYAGRIMELHTSGERNPHIQFQGYSTYEEALSAGIDKVIEILKGK